MDRSGKDSILRNHPQPMKSTLCLLLATLALSGCARHLSDRNSGVAYSYARTSAPFAAMSALAYLNEGEALSAEDRAAEKDVERCRDYLRDHHWKSVPSIRQDEECEAHGLQYRAWINESVKPAVLCIAFRGTEFKSPQDWRTNFRWIVRPFAGRDQYDLIEPKLRPFLCGTYRSRLLRGDLVVVTTGHSLGGGLAQNCLYHFSPQVSQCYAFDPSPVTAKKSISSEVIARYQNKIPINGFPDALILRIHQKGEILSYARNTLHVITGYSNQIDKIRFDVFDGATAVNLHNMSKLAEGIIDITKNNPHPAGDYNVPWWERN